LAITTHQPERHRHQNDSYRDALWWAAAKRRMGLKVSPALLAQGQIFCETFAEFKFRMPPQSWCGNIMAQVYSAPAARHCTVPEHQIMRLPDVAINQRPSTSVQTVFGQHGAAFSFWQASTMRVVKCSRQKKRLCSPSWG
jgi:hypothetical protein